MNFISNKAFIASTAALLILYAVLAYILPPPLFSAFFSGCQLVFGLLVAAAWANPAFRSIRSKEIDGSRLAVIGVLLVALGLVWSGVWSVSWNIAGRPWEWVSTPISTFSRALMAGGMAVLLISPDQAPRPRIGAKLWLIIAAIAVLVIASFALGFGLGSPQGL